MDDNERGVRFIIGQRRCRRSQVVWLISTREGAPSMSSEKICTKKDELHVFRLQDNQVVLRVFLEVC